MANKKKTKAVNYQKLYYDLLNSTDACLADLLDIKSRVFAGDITHADLQEELNAVYYKLSGKMDILETLEDGD
jgi:hypothetical protein